MQVLCDVYNMQPDEPKVVSESEGILEAIELETLHGEYKWSQILTRDEVQTGKRVLLAYGIQFMNQMGGINLVVVSNYPSWLVIGLEVANLLPLINIVLCDFGLAVQCWFRPKTESASRRSDSDYVRDWYVVYIPHKQKKNRHVY